MTIKAEMAQLQSIADDAVAYAKKCGADATEVGLSIDKGYTAEVRMGEVDKIEYDNDKSLAISVSVGQKTGHASTTDLSLSALHDCVEKALAIAKVSADDPYDSLPEKEELAFGYPDLEMYHPWKLSVEEAIEILRDMEAKGLAHDKRLTNSDGASLGTHEHAIVLANSLGFSGGYVETSHDLSLTLIGKSGDDMQRDGDYGVACDRRNLKAPEAIALEAAEHTVNRLGAKKIKSQTVPVLFIPEMAVGLIGSFLKAISGGVLYRRSSFLLDHLSELVFPDWFEIVERPLIKNTLGSAPFDAEGVRTRDKTIVDAGRLQSYLLSTYSAKRLGLKTTGNAGGTHNMLVKLGTQSFDDLIKTMDKGIIVTEMIGQGVDLVTGNYSRGASGFWVENGAIQYPIHEFTVAGNLKNMYHDIVAVGNDVDSRFTIQTGSILISNMAVAGE